MSLKNHKFYVGNIFNGPFNSDSLYTSFRAVAGLSDTINNSELKKQIDDYNHKKKEFGCYKTEYCDKLCVDEECQALAELYGKKIALVRQDHDAERKLVIRIDLYVGETSMDEEIVHILYDEINKKFSPLYAAKIVDNRMERITRFPHNDAVKNLLYKFIRNDLKYKGYVNSDGYNRTDEDQASTSTNGSNDSEDLSDIIDAGVSTSSIQLQNSTSDEHVPLSQKHTESLPSMLDKNNGDTRIKNSKDGTNRTSTCYKSRCTPVTLTKLLQSAKSVVESEYQLTETKTSDVSEETHEFYRHGVSGVGNSCLFRSIHYLLDFLKNASVKDLRELVAYHVRNDKNMNKIVSSSIADCDNIDDYCSEIRGNLMGGHPELIALSALFLIRIIVISVNTKGGTYDGNACEIGDEKLSKCIYVLLDKSIKHYDPLCIRNKQNPKDEVKIFPYKNQMVENLLDNFIKKEFDSSNESKTISDYVPSNLSSQRKRSGEDDSKSISNAKRSRTDSSPVMSILSASKQSTASLPYREEIKIEQESVKKSSDLKQNKDNFKSNTGLSIATTSCSDADSNNHHDLKILIREDSILANAQVVLDIRIVTENINRNIIGPSCKFQVKFCDNQIAYLDQVQILLANENEQRGDPKGIRQIQLPLIDMYGKTNKSMKVEQSLDFYRSPKDNGLVITKKIDEFGALKQADYLHGVYFEIVLYSKKLGENIFSQHDIQFLSRISVESKDSDMDIYSGI